LRAARLPGVSGILLATVLFAGCAGEAVIRNAQPWASGLPGVLNVSSQYLVDRDGTIYQLLPETTMARHTIGLNHVAIGIENVGNGTDLPLTNSQLASNAAIIRYLAGKYDLEYLIGHYEYTRFEGHVLWKEKDKAYRTEKTDPGEDFMQRIRVKVADLNLKGPPSRTESSEAGNSDALCRFDSPFIGGLILASLTASPSSPATSFARIIRTTKRSTTDLTFLIPV